MVAWYGVGAGWGGWTLMILAMVAFWALVVFAFVAIFRGADGPPPSSRRDHRDPLQILDERFARGEIDEEEYHARGRVLRASMQ